MERVTDRSCFSRYLYTFHYRNTHSQKLSSNSKWNYKLINSPCESCVPSHPCPWIPSCRVNLCSKSIAYNLWFLWFNQVYVELFSANQLWSCPPPLQRMDKYICLNNCVTHSWSRPVQYTRKKLIAVLLELWHNNRTITVAAALPVTL